MWAAQLLLLPRMRRTHDKLPGGWVEFHTEAGK
jgi:hypothetical protein